MALEAFIVSLIVVAFCYGIASALLTSCRCKDNRARIKRVARWIAFFLIAFGASELLYAVGMAWELPRLMLAQQVLSIAAYALLLYAGILIYRYSKHLGFRKSTYLESLEKGYSSPK
jgi:hypothetical protein